MKSKDRTKEYAVKQLEKRMIALGKERDALRNLYDELGSLLESCENAHDSLDECIQTLSQYA